MVVGLWGSFGLCVGCDLEETGDSEPRQHVWHTKPEDKCEGSKTYVAKSRDIECTSCQSWRLILVSTGRWVPVLWVGGQNAFVLSPRVWTLSPQSSENYWDCNHSGRHGVKSCLWSTSVKLSLCGLCFWPQLIFMIKECISKNLINWDNSKGEWKETRRV